MDATAIMKKYRIGVVIATYDNAGTIANVVRRVEAITRDIIVVDDGCTDNTLALLQQLDVPPHIVTYKPNRGKGHALVQGFKKAMQLGWDYVITLDSDGQHFPEDLPQLVAAWTQHKDALIVGERGTGHLNMPRGNTMANKFSNFWFTVQTGIQLNDTQTGFRLYPLKRLRWLGITTSRYEAELEMLVFAAWHGIEIVPVKVRVYYPPQGERVTHFRPWADFGRISLLNVALCFGAVVYGWPMRLYRKIKNR
ncbi:MAG: glycosyltransferase family 2 protein [Muribaculaceae bacterium]|jgi:glycosyltransferase involved in cell wall biosynthesis|uniref:glycosyltransferase family 2 protein n=1 Tax=Sodaliphilus pleomorphus TaxID=2606626 RepID=UPI00240A65ED|nr:glycosyltransferase family 2 protein [Sodaliphilus pleomorphus]MCI5981069.1 glycosyltransferase family 2 protein [Muribaculaceae bacterium]MDD6686955.1 glycosyltransferase family 2 protein [Sodaliphilus pleomorphus]